MSDETNIYCTKCGKNPEDILMLTCDHNLCLVCAAKNLRIQMEKSNDINQVSIKKEVQCEVCHKNTELEPASVTELLNVEIPEEERDIKDHSNAFIYPQNLENVDPPTPLQTDVNPFHKSNRTNPDQPQKTNWNKSEIHRSVQSYEKCPSHPEEDVKYFCFSCLTNPICSDCVIHGIHKTHDVYNVKKALPIVHSKLEEYVQSLKTKEAQLNSTIYTYQSKMKEISDQCRGYKENIKSMFDELRLKIDNKEKELSTFGDNCVQQSLNDIKASEKALTAKLLSIQGNFNLLNGKINSQDMNEILCFFAENSNKINQLLQNDKREPLEISNSTKSPINPEIVYKVKSKMSQISSELDYLDMNKILPQESLDNTIVSKNKETYKSVNQGKSFI